MEYKEFWIQASNMIAHDDKPPIAKQLFHVIEYAAFEKLQKDWEEAATKNYADKCEIEKLKKQNEIMREALSFYANEMNYSIDDYRGISGEMINRCILYTDCEERNDVYSYAGKRARQALKDVEGVG